MELKAKLFPIKNPNGRIIWMDPGKKASSVHTSELTYLGLSVDITVDPITNTPLITETGYVLYETADLDVVIVEADFESAVKDVTVETLQTLIESTKMTTSMAVSQGLGKFSHTLTEGWFTLGWRKHIWSEEKHIPEEEAF